MAGEWVRCTNGDDRFLLSYPSANTLLKSLVTNRMSGNN